MGWDVEWQHGVKGEPPLQVHRYDEATWILRQSKRVNYEGPFLPLLLGETTALLLDTGTSADPAVVPLRETVDELVGDRRLVVAHTHGHGDHVGGDAQFADRPGTDVVGRSAEEVAAFFGLDAWPDGAATFDLGGRALEIVPVPGHQAASIAVHDPRTGLLFTGDTILPGRLYVADPDAYAAGLDRLADLVARREVSWLVGCHIEQTGDGREYPLGRIHQPEEGPLQLPVSRLAEIRALFGEVRGTPGFHRRDGIVILNDPRPADLVRLQVTGLVDRVLRRRPR